MANYDNVFEKMSIADLKPQSIDVPQNTPGGTAHRRIDTQNVPLVKKITSVEGTVAGNTSDKILDQREHFPVITETQARSSMNRAMQLSSVPNWYSGTLDELRYDIFCGITKAHPALELKTPTPIKNIVMALSDGQDSPKTKRPLVTGSINILLSRLYEQRQSIANQANLEGVFEDNDTRKAFAGDLLKMLQNKQDRLNEATLLANRLIRDGMTGKEFSDLMLYLQEDVINCMTSEDSVSVYANRRQELLARINPNQKD